MNNILKRPEYTKFLMKGYHSFRLEREGFIPHLRYVDLNTPRKFIRRGGLSK
jgi:hypothetical protein